MRTGRQRRGSSGFTLIELIIVVTVIAVIASIAIPNLLAARLNANESAAIATLKNLSSAQATVIASPTIDSNSDGIGEYGYFLDLSGASNIRMDTDGDGIADAEGQESVSPPVLSVAFGEVDGNGFVTRSGYVFQMYLPGAGLKWVREGATTTVSAGGGGGGGAADMGGRDVVSLEGVSADGASAYWACYAWPTSYGNSGRRAFFINQTGQIVSCSNRQTRYSGRAARPSPTAAVLASASTSMSASIAANSTGQDGNLWKTVQ